MPNELKRFLFSTALFGATAAALAGAILATPATSDYLAAFVDKMDALDSTPSPRIVFIGGSSLAFGLDSKLVEEALGMPVLNTGLHAGAGLRFMLDHVGPRLKRGDVAVIIPEYATLSNRFTDDEGTIAAVLLSDFPSSARAVLLEDLPLVVRGFPDFAVHRLLVEPSIEVARRMGLRNDYPYLRAGFDARGDEVGHLRAPKPIITLASDIDPAVDIHVAMLNAFGARAEAAGINVVFLYQGIAESVLAENRENLKRLDVTIRGTLHVATSGPPEEAVQPDALFSDTVNHLSAEGRKRNAERIIRQLRPVLTWPEPGHVLTSRALLDPALP